MIDTKGIAYPSQSMNVFKTVLLTAVMMLAACGTTAVDPLPPQLKTLKLGMPSEKVVAMIKGSGSYTKAPLKKRKTATGITWIPGKSRYFKKIVFQFAEDDRLYLVGFYVKGDLRWQLRPLREGFFERFDISPEKPYRINLGSADVIVYSTKDSELTFFNYRDIKSGETAFELFSAGISHHGRTLQKKVKTASGPGEKTAESPKSGPTGGDALRAAGKGQPSAPKAQQQDQSRKPTSPR
jgi:hypothetical protein